MGAHRIVYGQNYLTMLRSLESQLIEALEELGSYYAPEEEPSTLEEYEKGIDQAIAIASAALRVLNLARAILEEREQFRSDFIQAVREKGMTPEDLYGVSNKDFL